MQYNIIDIVTFQVFFSSSYNVRLMINTSTYQTNYSIYLRKPLFRRYGYICYQTLQNLHMNICIYRVFQNNQWENKNNVQMFVSIHMSIQCLNHFCDYLQEHLPEQNQRGKYYNSLNFPETTANFLPATGCRQL